MFHISNYRMHRMKEFMIIRNFGPIENVEIKLKRINLFIGEQGVGKRTIAKLYSCMQDVLLHFLIVFSRDQQKIKAIFQRYGIHTYFNDDTYIEFGTNTGLIVKYEGQKFTISSPTLNKEEIEIYVIRLISDSVTHSLKGAGLSVGDDFDSLPEKEKEIMFSNLRTSFYLPAERSLLGCTSNSLSSLLLAKVPLPKMLMEFLSFFEKAKNEYQEYEVPFLGLTFKASQSEDKIQIGDKEIAFKYCSSGIQSIVPMLMIVDYCLKQDYFSCFALEEPEINLFPTNQLELIRYIISKVNQEKGINNLIITTHSPYILSIINVSILAGKVAEMTPQLADEVSAVLRPEFYLHSSEIEVFSLGKDINGGTECESIFDSQTGLIKGNYLDAVSSIISADFNKLNKIYIKALREQ